MLATTPILKGCSVQRPGRRDGHPRPRRYSGKASCARRVTLFDVIGAASRFRIVSRASKHYGAAVDHDGLAGDEIAVGRSEIDQRPGEVAGTCSRLSARALLMA